MSLTTSPPLADPHSLQARVASALYLVHQDGNTGYPPYPSLGAGERARWERMAAMALSIAYREPVTAA